MTVDVAYRVSPHAYLVISSLAHLGWMLVRCDVTWQLLSVFKEFSIFLLLVIFACIQMSLSSQLFYTLPYGCSFFASASFLLHNFPNLLSRQFLYLLFSDSLSNFYSIQGGCGLGHLGRVKNCVSQSTQHTNYMWA